MNNIIGGLHQIGKILNNINKSLPCYYCPKCRKPVTYILNPEHIVHCKNVNCKWDGTESQLLSIENVIYGEEKEEGCETVSIEEIRDG